MYLILSRSDKSANHQNSRSLFQIILKIFDSRILDLEIQLKLSYRNFASSTSVKTTGLQPAKWRFFELERSNRSKVSCLRVIRPRRRVFLHRHVSYTLTKSEIEMRLFLRSKGIRLKSELPAVNSGLKNLTQMNAVETVSKVLIKNFWEKNRSHCITYAFYWVTCIVTSWGLCVIRLINHIKIILLNNHLNSVAFTVAFLTDFTQNEFF